MENGMELDKGWTKIETPATRCILGRNLYLIERAGLSQFRLLRNAAVIGLYPTHQTAKDAAVNDFANLPDISESTKEDPKHIA